MGRGSCTAESGADTARMSVTIEVRSLGGELVLQRPFLLRDSVEAVKEQIKAVRCVPAYQQQLVWQGEVLQNHQVLGELGLPAQRAGLQLAVQVVPDDAEISRARQLVQDLLGTVDMLDENSVREIRICSNPPLAIEVVCIGVLWLLAGISPKIATKANGSPKDPSWSTCQEMLNDPDFPAYLRQLPSQISCGRLRKKNFDASGQRFTDLQPFIEAQMANDIRCDCCAVKALFNWLSVVGTFYKVATGITERIGDSLGSTSLFDIISHAPTQFVSR